MQRNLAEIDSTTPYYLWGTEDSFPARRPSGLAGDADVPLCVDLDHTFTHTDLLLESVLVLLKQNPLYVFACLFWLLKGKAWLKAQVASRVSIDVAVLPYDRALLDYLQQEKKNGRSVYLCTAAHWTHARRIADHFGLFSGVLASSESTNLSGRNKAAALVNKFGEHGFDYCGDALTDVPVWKEARRAIVVGSRRIASAASRVNDRILFFERKRAMLRLVVKEMRVYQWVKNTLIFVPLLASHRFTDFDALAAAGIAFVSFCLCASSVYLLNDLLDLDADRRHARKCRRPLASGELPISFGIGLSGGLLVASVALAALLPWKFALVLAGYFAATLAYSFVLKRQMLIDVFTLAGLYTVRIVAGGKADDIALSYWLVLFSGLMFVSLAMVKRYAELDAVRRSGKTEAAGRGYFAEDTAILCALGTAAAYAAVLVLALYMNSPDITGLYRHQQPLWVMFGLLLYWISRMWMLAFRGRMTDDPIIFAARDHVSQIVIGLCVVCVMVAI
ncbi:UbiA family prenyltransferase [Paraburkholderia caballeronis]|uniref:UbiA family prenyltransferase n=1 Tax=Paraburkholderia caballeronis TaxID=416943 RepID=UPI0010648496|nr:UbiA family prenyltransferase [Paraburkholderia caballeronis]TDV17083.1 4-hydroxybenzoate polyprenyltransferase [Paraburkholderia caballeronis]TDV17468.1 4-hydroxybenzoate polyprenyltransferase [Paraburkholderia caballeronis]TDV27486.1 4-hydroxybenzoate polyprenyltransferase [Paraburkholderia caballeronis]TDV36220.1 4-hydroxybenzoate polyprenyltransferase [Paraburkholderia caballeronis]